MFAKVPFSFRRPMETKNTLERRILLIGSHKRLLFDRLCAAAERYEKHVQYHDVYYLYYTLNEEPFIVELTLAGIEHTGAREMAIRTADGVIISYAANYPASFNDLTSLLEDFKMRKNKNAPILVVRNEDEHVDLDPTESSSSYTESSEDQESGKTEIKVNVDDNTSAISVEQGAQLAKEFGPICEQTSLKLSETTSTLDLILDFLKKVLETDRRQRRRSTILDGLKQLNAMTINKLKRHDKDGSSSHSSTSDISPAGDQENVEEKTKENKEIDTKSEPATPVHSRSFMKTFRRNQTAPSNQKHNNSHNQEVEAESGQSKVCVIM
uniref:Ras-associating domain-containing protein n=1 Tax=Bursaphelenchus xylophilus TaxID=6326 RepID=A0A1I7SMM2_BURXY